MIFMKRFLLMLQFFTTIPLRIDLKADEKDFGKGLVFAPVVGLIIGLALAGFYSIIISVFSPQVAAALIIVLYIFLTGGLHLDGLADTSDGVFSNRSRERMLEIMRDSRIGTNGVLAIICVVLLYWCLFSQLDYGFLSKALILMPVSGKIGSLIGAGVSTYARTGQGLGKSFIDYCGLKEIVLGILISSVIFFGISRMEGLLVLLIPVITAFLLVRFFSYKVGGATGDILGAVCEIVQVLFLIFIYLLQTLGCNL
ncbi:MAG: adenosylcobinamide-GDP ribazoletransferase [Clostridia bacterium]|nr:adenosylcobinamide-GDP ribazoletransferase [Clostridia bacterium]